LADALRDRVGVYAGFAATGIALALPGALMPAMLARWGLGDARGGWLLFCFFAGTTAGALCARGPLARAAAAGSWLTSLGAIWLTFAGSAAALLAMFGFGAGLGLVMTAVMLLQSRRFPAERRTEMTRLNLLWAAGACAAPTLGLGFGGGVSVVRAAVVFCAMAAAFAVFGLWCWFGESQAAQAVVGSLKDSASPHLTVREAKHPFQWMTQIGAALLLLVFCETGVESSAGGWLAAFASRQSDSAHAVVGAATCYWAGILGSRLVFSSRRMERVPERGLLLANLAAMVLAFAAMLAWPLSGVTMVAAAALGFAQGPVYPLLMAMALRRREAQGIFVVAGLGSSLLPLATGAVSQHMGTLRAGLGVPLAAVGLMLAVGWLGMAAPLMRKERA